MISRIRTSRIWFLMFLLTLAMMLLIFRILILLMSRKVTKIDRVDLIPPANRSKLVVTADYQVTTSVVSDAVNVKLWEITFANKIVAGSGETLGLEGLDLKIWGVCDPEKIAKLKVELAGSILAEATLETPSNYFRLDFVQSLMIGAGSEVTLEILGDFNVAIASDACSIVLEKDGVLISHAESIVEGEFQLEAFFGLSTLTQGLISVIQTETTIQPVQLGQTFRLPDILIENTASTSGAMTSITFQNTGTADWLAVDMVQVYFDGQGPYPCAIGLIGSQLRLILDSERAVDEGDSLNVELEFTLSDNPAYSGATLVIGLEDVRVFSDVYLFYFGVINEFGPLTLFF